MDRQEMLGQVLDMFKEAAAELSDEQLYALLCHPEEFHDLILQASFI